jgi:hypothetical protein
VEGEREGKREEERRRARKNKDAISRAGRSRET